MFCIVVISMFAALFFSCTSVVSMEEAKGTVLIRKIVCYDKPGKSISVPVALLKQSKTIDNLIDASTDDVSAPIRIALYRCDWKGLVQPALQSIEDRKGAEDIGSIIGKHIEKCTTVKGKLRRYVRALNGADYLDIQSLQQEITKSFVGFLESSAVCFKYFKVFKKLAPPMQDQLARALNYPFVRMATIENGEDVYQLVFSPDGKQFVSESGGKGTIKVWDAQTHRLCKTLENFERSLLALAFRPDGRHLVSGRDLCIKIWNAQTYALLGKLNYTNDFVRAVAFSPDSRQLISGSFEGIIHVWDAERYELSRTLDAHRSSVCALAFSPDGRRFASGSDNRTIKLWDPETCTLFATLNDSHTGSIRRLAFSPDNKQLVSGSRDKSIKVWDLGTHALLVTLNHTKNGHTGSIHALVFSSDGRQLISGSEDSGIKVWNSRTYALLATLGHTAGGHTDPVSTLAFRPDAAQLISGSTDRKIKVWNSANALDVSNPSLALLLYFAKRKQQREERALVVDDPGLKQLFDQLPEHEQKHFLGLCGFSLLDQ